jgi:hypothetical protein
MSTCWVSARCQRSTRVSGTLAVVRFVQLLVGINATATSCSACAGPQQAQYGSSAAQASQLQIVINCHSITIPIHKGVAGRH